MKLSEAIRLGAMLGKKMDGKLYDGYGGGGSCAVGSALLALGLGGQERWDLEGPDHWGPLLITYPYLNETTPCPACSARMDALGLIAHLNNKTKRPQDSHQPHDWTREQIADWVETIEAQHDVKSADIAVAVTV